MSCLEECCRPEVEIAPNQTAVEQTSFVPAECPDEAVDLAVNGLEGMASLVSGSSLPEIEVEKNASFKSSVLKRTRTTDLEILRGITLRDSLRSRGSLWRKNPMYLPDLLSFSPRVPRGFGHI